MIQLTVYDNPHYAPFGSPNASASQTPESGYSTGKNLYDRFYEGNEPTLDPPGLFDYSKGAYTSVTSNAVTQVWSNGELVDRCIHFLLMVKVDLQSTEKLSSQLSGFSSAGAR